MWQCHKCSKPVYFAERKQSLGYDWHPECLRCEECGKRLNPGQHAEHKGIPYCHVPCYGALFGPQLFGHGTRVESHKSFGAKGLTPKAVNSGQMPFPREQIEAKLKQYNQYFDNKSHEIRSREVNGRLILEGALRVYWGVQNMIHLKEDDDQRTVVTVRKRNSCRYSNSTDFSSEKSLLVHGASVKENLDVNESGDVSTSSLVDGGDTTDISMTESISFDTCSFNEDINSLTSGPSSKEVSPDHRYTTLPTKLDGKVVERDELDELLQVERHVNSNEKMYQTLPSPASSQSSPEKQSSIQSNVACVSSSTQPDDLSKSESNDISKTETDYKSAETTRSITTDNSTLTNKSNDDEFYTPMNTLKPVDFDDFKRQIREEFIQNSSELQHSNDDTLKSRQPIDPSRINDSLKLYSENIMSKSFSGEAAFREVPSSIQYQTLNNNKSDSSNSTNYALKKSGSTAVSSSSDLSASTDNGINRSRSGPNWYRNQHLNDNDSDDSSATLKPATIHKRSIHIKMDCYDEIRNGVSSTTSEASTTTLNTPTSPLDDDLDDDLNECVVVLRKPKTGSTAIKRRSGNRRARAKLKRRCSINGHFYNRETSFFTPPHGSQMSVWVTSLVSTQEAVNLLLEKYKVDNRPENFALFIIRDNGEQRRLKDDDYPLLVRTMLGPHEDVARLFLTDAHNTSEISCEVAQFINLSIQECRSILDRYNEEQAREVQKIKEKYADLRQRIIQRMESLKVRL
ncbi:uncharacterized protein LOC129578562 [Sitodiplosis mosellana]|uniref:uncharacterized protein LOC129578562 n=1 Tax=Sitodiplosis mosellana TaxID=263140 RepID=UPI00244493B2|nr:uncharacterized protein LOC129578562 [Sitodiplosis mosellana]